MYQNYNHFLWPPLLPPWPGYFSAWVIVKVGLPASAFDPWQLVSCYIEWFCKNKCSMSLVCSQPFSGFPSQIKSHSPQNYLQGPGNFPPVISVIISSPIPFASLFLLVSRVTFNEWGVLLSMINTYSESVAHPWDSQSQILHFFSFQIPTSQ